MTIIQKIKSREAKGGFIVLLFLVLFFSLTIIFRFCPLIIDDNIFFSYNCQNIGDAISHALYYGNGRFLGNLGSIWLATHSSLAIIFKAFTTSLLCILIPKIFDAKNKSAYFLSSLLVLSVPEKMFAQSISWNCGNVNYILPILLTMLCLLILSSKDQRNIFFALKALGILVLGFCSQLFMEHNSIINLLIACALFTYFIVKRKQYKPQKSLLAFLWTIATIVGTTAMLLIPKHFIDESTMDMSAYRGFSLNSPKELVLNLINNGSTMISHFVSHFILMLALGVVVHRILKHATLRDTKAFRLVEFLKALNILFISFSFIYPLFIKNIIPSTANHQFFLQAVMLGICVSEILLFFAVCFFFSKERVASIIGLTLMISSLAPLLIVNPIGERTSFLGMVVLIMTATYFVSKTEGECTTDDIRKCHLILVFSIIAMLSCLFVSYFNIHGHMTTMENYIESEMKKGSTVIETFEIPNLYCHHSKYVYYSLEYRYYYHAIGDIEFKEIPYYQWIANRIKEADAEKSE